MKIQAAYKYKDINTLKSPACYPSFKAATVNINTLSDTHGELLLANNALEEMRSRQQDIFCKEGKGNANIFAICGDWFMDEKRKGYSANPDLENGYFQLAMLNEFLKQIKNISKNTIALFIPGNHEFDGGVSLLDDILSKLNAEVLISNLDTEHSPGFEKSISSNKIINQKIIEIDDDKNPNLKHRMLFLGICPVNMQAYQKNLDGVKLSDNINKSQKFVNREDYEKTLDICKSKIKNFKEKNPNGIVVFLSHTGVNFADNLARESDVDIIFDGHEHKDNIRIVNSTPIIPLSQNFKKIANAKIQIDDNGEVKQIELKSFSPLSNKTKGTLLRFYCKLFKTDIRKKYKIKASDPEIKTLDTNGIRQGNNYLANFITDAILTELKKQDPEIKIFALNASAIRRSLKISDKVSVSKFDVMNVLSGIKEDDGQIMTTDVTGKELAYIVLDNLLFNNENPEKNPIIHYSGLIINKTKILEKYSEINDFSDLTEYIIDTDTKEPIKPDKTYRIANVEKYFNKSANSIIRNSKNKSLYIGKSVQELFKQYFENNKDNLYANCDMRII